MPVNSAAGTSSAPGGLTARDSNSPSPPPNVRTETDLLSRMRRALTNTAKAFRWQAVGQAASGDDRQQPQADKPATAAGTSDSVNEGDIATKDHSKKATTFERFMSVVRRKEGDIQFPPAHWFESGASDSSQSHAMPPVTSTPTLTPDADRSAEVENGDGPEGIAIDDEGDNEAGADPLPEPTSLAHRIQTLLSSVPSPFISTSPSGSTSQEPAMVSDRKLITILSSPFIMNGSVAQGRESVWSALDRLKAKLPGLGGQEAEGPRAGSDSAGVEEEGGELDEESGVMVYGPLVPQSDSEVEVARSEIISLDDSEDQSRTDDVRVPSREPECAGSSSSLPSSKGKQKEEAKGEVHRRAKNEKKVWIPSDTKISVQVMWWGYRIYLPPPVLSILDDKRLEATKRAAMLTTALKWLLDRIPLAVVPLQARPALKLVKGLSPYLGYVGTFIAWSWGSIKKYDKGKGVILTATWLLSIALVPKTWEDADSQHVPEATASLSQEGISKPSGSVNKTIHTQEAKT